MIAKFRQLLQPPRLGSEDLNRRARLLHITLLFIIAFTILMASISSLVAPDASLEIVLTSIALLVELICYFILRSGRIRLAGAILVFTLWAVLMLDILLIDGVRGTSLLGQVLLIFFSGLLIGPAFSTGLTILTLAGNYLAMTLELNAGLVYSGQQLGLAATWVFQAVYLLLAFGLMLALGRSIRESLQVMEHNEQGLKEHVAELRRAQAELEASQANLRRREAILVALRAASEELFRNPSFESSVQKVLADLGIAADIDRIYMSEIQLDDRGELYAAQRFTWVKEGIRSHIDNPELDAFYFERRGFGRWIETLSRGGVIKGHVLDFPESERGFLTSLGTISDLVVPIFVGPRWWGYIGFDETKQMRHWSPAEEDALRGAGGILGGAIERRHAEQALAHSEARYLGILQDQFDLIGRYTPDGRLIFANSAYARYFGVDPDQIADLTIFTQVPPEEVEALKAKITSLTPRQPVAVSRNLNRRFDGEQRWLEWTDRGSFDEQGRLIEVQAVGRDIDEEVRLRRELEENLLQMERQAMTDSLTGLLNRRAIMDHADAEWQRAQRERRPLSLLVMDVDRLKEINDTFGHLAGDQALIRLADLMRNGMRRYDWVGRWGGDEFLLVLPGTSSQEASEVAERLRSRFKQHRLKLKDGEEIELRVSMGVATQDVIDPAVDRLQDLLARADQAQYKAKQAGRDQVEVGV